jgi:hypothetical protein
VARSKNNNQIPRRKPGDPFDWDVLNKYLEKKPSLSDTAEMMKCSEDTLENMIKAEHGITFSEYRDKKMAGVRLGLVTKALDMAMGGNVTMMIFCLKNVCGWADKTEINSTNNKIEITIASNDANL